MWSWSAVVAPGVPAVCLTYWSKAFCCWAACCAARSCILPPRAIRYTKTPRYGMTMMQITHRALAQPPMSWLRKMSMNTMNSSQIQMMKRKK